MGKVETAWCLGTNRLFTLASVPADCPHPVRKIAVRGVIRCAELPRPIGRYLPHFEELRHSGAKTLIAIRNSSKEDLLLAR
jgi:hypothetical protein